MEQIDGVIELDGHLYLVEIKWYSDRLGRQEVSPMLVTAFTRAEARALIISASGFTSAAIAECRNALAQKVVVLAQLQEIVVLLENGRDLRGWLREKARAAQVEREPLRIA